MSLFQMQVMLAVLSAASFLSAAWLVLHARDVALLLRSVLPLHPGGGRRLAGFPWVCGALTLFGFSIAGQALVVIRAVNA